MTHNIIVISEELYQDPTCHPTLETGQCWQFLNAQVTNVRFHTDRKIYSSNGVPTTFSMDSPQQFSMIILMSLFLSSATFQGDRGRSHTLCHRQVRAAGFSAFFLYHKEDAVVWLQQLLIVFPPNLEKLSKFEKSMILYK